MNPKQIELVETTWEKVLPIAAAAAELFYNRLFEIDPSTRALCGTDMKEQGRKLVQMIDEAVKGLTCLDSLVPAVQSLGSRHAGYQVKDEHYDSVAAALLWTLGKGLGEAFTPEVKEAWTAAYSTLAGVMKQAPAQAA